MIGLDAGKALLDTVPGRTFVAGVVDDYIRSGGDATRSSYLRSLAMADMVFTAQMDVSSYLYGAGIDDASNVSPLDGDTAQMADAIAVELARPDRDTFTTPQHHLGHADILRAPQIANRRSPSEVLPSGALWTSTPLVDGIDSWTYSRENVDPIDTYELHFEPRSIRVARIDSASDWGELLRSHSRDDSKSETLYPDWRSISKVYDAVHLSLIGLLTAHPSLSEVVATDSRQNYAHSKMGKWAGVGDWSTVSTAWLTLPDQRRWVLVDTPLSQS